MSANTDQSKQNTRPPSLTDLVGFDVPKLTAKYEGNETTYILEADNEKLERLKAAAETGQHLLYSGIEAISGLLITIKMHCPNEVRTDDEIGAMWLINELSQLLSVTNEAARRLDIAIANQP